ncbi:hypothetical protein [Amycolatopsis nigrescens]|nr:hypothetical protein [Amycolatopsis nigrescens]
MDLLTTGRRVRAGSVTDNELLVKLASPTSLRGAVAIASMIGVNAS